MTRNKLRGLFAAALAVVMLALPVSNLQAADTVFTDIGGLDAATQNYIEDIAAQGIVGGYADGTFKPNGTVSRSQIAKMVTVSLALGTGEVEFTPFTDIVKLDEATQAYINTLASNGIVKGMPGTTKYAPNGAVNRSQIAKIVTEAFDLDMGEVEVEFEDTKKLDADTQGYIDIMASNGIVSGYPQEDGTVDYRPFATVSRSQFAKIISLAIDLVEVDFIVLHTNDIHGYVEEDDATTKVGFPRYKTAIVRMRANEADTPVFVVDAGDATQGSRLANTKDGADIVDLMNLLGVQAFVPGNHEFDHGQEAVFANQTNSNFTWYASNITKADGSHPFSKGEIIPVTSDDGSSTINVGVFGMATPETLYKAHPDNMIGLEMPEDLDENVEIAQGEADKLREEGADFVIMLSHFGTDLASGELTATRLAEEVTGVDLIVDGHSHSEWPEGYEVGNSTIVSTGTQLAFIGKVVLTKVGNRVMVNAVLLDKPALTAELGLVSITPDGTLQGAINTILAEQGVIYEEVIGKTAVELDGVRNNVRSQETNLANLITDAMLDASEADVVLTNGGGIRASIDVGDITKGEVFDVLPFGNMLYTIEVSGQEIVDALNFGVSDYPNPAGKFPQVAGMTYEIVEGTPSTVTNVLVDGEAINLSAKYKLATNDFMSAGGDGYDMFKGKPLVQTAGSLDTIVEAFIAELTAAAPAAGFTYETDGRITVAGADALAPAA